ncbi:MAG: YbaB/EbfC family nucleoid-associated protein [Pyrinomonadaceae bacterium]
MRRRRAAVVVTVMMTGNKEVGPLKIDPEAIKDGDVEMLQDMIVAAINEASRKVDEAMKGINLAACCHQD